MFVGCLALAGFPLPGWILEQGRDRPRGLHATHSGRRDYADHRRPDGLLHVPHVLLVLQWRKTPAARRPVEHPHEAPPVMIAPLVVLALGAIFAGYLGVGGAGGPLNETFFTLQPHGYFHHYLNPETSTIVKHAHAGGGSTWLMYVSAPRRSGRYWAGLVAYTARLPRKIPIRACLVRCFILVERQVLRG